MQNAVPNGVVWMYSVLCFNIDDIKLNTYIRLDDSLLESSVKNIKVVDNKAVDDWDNGTVFEVTDSDDTVSSNTNDNNSSNSEDEIDALSHHLHKQMFYVY